jgi:hypothetical protein
MVSDPAAVTIHQQPAANKPAHEFQNTTNPAPAHSLTHDPNASYTTLPWQSSAANVASTGRSTTPDANQGVLLEQMTSEIRTEPTCNQQIYGILTLHP